MGNALVCKQNIMVLFSYRFSQNCSISLMFSDPILICVFDDELYALIPVPAIPAQPEGKALE
jgi:hypothetical protein